MVPLVRHILTHQPCQPCQPCQPLVVVKPPSLRKREVDIDRLMDPPIPKDALTAYSVWLQQAISSENGYNWAQHTAFIIHVISRIADISMYLPCKYMPIEQRLAAGITYGFGPDLPIKNNAVEIGSIMDRFTYVSDKERKEGKKQVRALPMAIRYVIYNQQRIYNNYPPKFLAAIFGSDINQIHPLLCRISQVIHDELKEMIAIN